MFNVWSKIKELINVAHPVVLFENESNTSDTLRESHSLNKGGVRV